jgi:hypothetical protein
MLMRVVILMLLLVTADAALAKSYSFESRASGRLGRPIKFLFYRDWIMRAKTDIQSFTVSVWTSDHRWKAVWSVDGGRRLTEPIEYGVTPPGFGTPIAPRTLLPGLVYLGSASDGHGGLSAVIFRFDKNGRMTFPDSLD